MSGDKRAFDCIVSKYEKPIFNIAYRMVANYEDAMDLTQTIFLKSYEKLESFDTSRNFFSWIYRITINEAINFCKMKKLAAQIDGDIPSIQKRGPEEFFAQSELHEHLQKAMKELSFDYKIVIILKHFQGLSYKEISDILELPEKTVRSRLFSARQLLKNKLIQQGCTP